MITTPRPLETMMAENQLVKHYAGSHSYGMALPTSDVDFRGIFVADPIYIRSPFYSIGEITDASEEDTKFYELNKFMKLALECNPNVIETLWVDQQSVVFDTPEYQLLRDNRGKFLTSKIAFTTSGYAFGQLKRIKGHNKWITHSDKGIQKLRSLYVAGSIDIPWLETHFSEAIILQVTK